MSVNSYDISVVIPAYNEEAVLEESVSTLENFVEEELPSLQWEILICENGSEDDSLAIAKELAKGRENIRWLTITDAGRGGAVQAGIEAASGQTVFYTDADLSISLSSLPTVVNGVTEDGYDISVGSRWLNGTKTYDSKLRTLLSRGYNRTLTLLFDSDLKDHQCGFKAFNRDRVLPIIETVEDNSWFWDTELLIRAQDDTYQIEEVPVQWETDKDSSVNVIKDGASIGIKMLRFWWSLNVR